MRDALREVAGAQVRAGPSFLQPTPVGVWPHTNSSRSPKAGYASKPAPQIVVCRCGSAS